MQQLPATAADTAAAATSRRGPFVETLNSLGGHEESIYTAPESTSGVALALGAHTVTVRRSRTKWCAVCGTSATSARPLKKCGGCHAVEYCSSECQLSHWRQAHKHACHFMAAQRKQTT
ncbi:hypothetical protein JKP88DRAFT_218286 [Tribonema minus]|uniref:MYND-type domain-containing protein n=1 Tax=Tribonema minus TaxID=303371 RepID=A0A835ZAG0_9STRA|nr:hypothetical protein JKP88DRAFT_218286 [Tribonema minus]